MTRNYLTFVFLFFNSSLLFAGLNVGATAGLMQQPSSQYYLFTQGVNLDYLSPQKAFIARAQYIERPVYKDQGIAEQDSALMLGLGGKIFSKNSLLIRALGGVGRVGGYIKSETTNERRVYSLDGVMTTAEIGYEAGWFEIMLGQTTFVGYVEKSQVEALVGWPFNFVHLSVNCLLSF